MAPTIPTKPTNLIIETQKALNKILGAGLAIDGAVGPKTNKALQDFDLWIREKFKQKNYSNLERYEYVGLRFGKHYTNQFNDIAVMWDTKNPLETRFVSFSTLPGLYGEGAILQPKKIYTASFPAGYQGTGVVCDGRFIDTWYLEENDPRNWSGNPYLMQCAAVKIGRDGDKDLNIEYFVTETDFGNSIGGLGAEFGMNHHGYFDYDVDTVNNISLGCQVYMKSRLFHIIAYWRKIIAEKKRNRVSYTLITI